MDTTLTHWKQLQKNDYIGAYCFQPDEEKVFTIVSVSQKEIVGGDGKKSTCTIAELKEDKPIVLNRTNQKRITKIAGSPYIQHWAGVRITVYVEKGIKAFGGIVDALRVRPNAPLLPFMNPESPKWPGAMAAIKAGTVKIEAIEKAYQLSAANKALLTAK
ncbi:MAG: hypothetical protein H7320_16920 [Ferruginibacter sp.]|nr:hypothetical protein [Ferruginibacter sp.]